MTISYKLATEPTSSTPSALVASGRFNADSNYRYPVAPPADWFKKRHYSEPHGVRIEDTGQVFGYLCSWKVTHNADQFSGRTAPRSSSDYAYFHVGQVLTAEGTKVNTGVLTADSYHPSIHLDATGAASHYDNTGCGVADVRVFEDSYGIQIAGALRPDVTDAQARMLRASDYSPDWRPVSRKGFANRPLEMVAVMACNLSGFITNALVASGGEGVGPADAVAPGESLVVTDAEDNVVFMCGTAWSVKGDSAFSENGDELPAEVVEELSSLRDRVGELEQHLALDRVRALKQLEELGI